MTVAPEANLSATLALDGKSRFSTSDAEQTLVPLGTHYFTVDMEPLPPELVEFLATDLASVVPALLHYATFSAFSVVQKRGNHWDKPKWREIQQSHQSMVKLSLTAPNDRGWE